jgi:general secretion pathway protein L
VTVDADDMDRWLAELAEAGLDAAALVPAALVLPRPDAGMVTAELGGEPLARARCCGVRRRTRLTGLLRWRGERWRSLPKRSTRACWLSIARRR